MGVSEQWLKEAQERLSSGTETLKALSGSTTATIMALENLLRLDDLGQVKAEIRNVITVARNEGNLHVQLIGAITSIATAAIYDVGSGISGLMETNQGLESLRSNQEARKKASDFNNKLRTSAALGDWKEHDRIAREYYEGIIAESDEVIANAKESISRGDGEDTTG